MIEQLVEFETAKLAKERGFNEECWDYYDNGGVSRPNITKVSNKMKLISAPTQSLLQKWLREVHNIKLTVMFRENSITGTESWDWLIKGIDVFYKRFKTYEEALEKGLIEALKLI